MENTKEYDTEETKKRISFSGCSVQCIGSLESLNGTTINARRLGRVLKRNNVKRADIERLATALNYDAPQLETDIEALVGLAAYGKKMIERKIRAAASANA